MPRRLMKIVMVDLRGKIYLVYLYDIVIFSPSVQQYFQDLHAVMQKLCDAGLNLNLKKSHFCLKEVKNLDHIVSAKGITADEEKIKAIKDFPVPTAYQRPDTTALYQVSLKLQNPSTP